MPEPVLNGASVVPGVGQGVAAALPQHVRVHGEIEAGARADALDQSIGGIWLERGSALSRKDGSPIPGIAGEARGAP
jgi:hypothetical protein